MNYSTAVMLINPSIRAVRGQYEDRGTTEVFKTIDQSLKIGDLAVVETSTRWGMTVFKVTAVDVEVDFDSSTTIGWVVGRVDQAQHDNIKTMEQKAIEVIKAGELRKRREEIKKNTLDAVAAGEIEKLDIVSLGTPQIANQS